MIYRSSVGCAALLAAALLAAGCAGSFGVGAGSAAPETAVANGLTGDWVLDAAESDQPLRGGAGEGPPGAGGGRGGGAGRGSTGVGGAGIANREAVAALFTIASERPSAILLVVTDSTFRIGRSASAGTDGPRPLNLRIGAGAQEIYRNANVSVTAQVLWRGGNLRLERNVTDAGTVTDSYSIDRYGRLILSRSLHFARNPGNRSVRFVYRRGASSPS